jgi:hypothetical protein
MGKIIDYASPPKTPPPTLTGSIALAAVIQFLILGCASVILDGGALLHECAFAAVGYWVGVAIIGIRRGYRDPKPDDRRFVQIGYFVLLLITFVLTAIIVAIRN